MGKITAAGDKMKQEDHEKMAEHGPNSSKGEHATEATKYAAKKHAEKHI